MTTAIPETTIASFKKDVIAATRPVLVDFYADWCAPCQMMSPVIELIADEFGDALDVVKIDVDRNPQLANAYRVRGIPTLMLFKDGDLVETVVGATSRNDLANTIKPYV